MKTISLDESEAALLSELLKGDQARLLMEIAHTDTREYKEYLKARENALESILCKIN